MLYALSFQKKKKKILKKKKNFENFEENEENLISNKRQILIKQQAEK